MDLSENKPKYFIAKSFLNGFLIFILSSYSLDLSGTLNSKVQFYPNSSFHNKNLPRAGFIKGRVIQSSSFSPVCFADIFNSNKTSYAKSNSKGEFILVPIEFPVELKIRRFGFKEETLIINNQVDSVLISLTPLEVHKSYSGNKKLLQYDVIFRKALEKLGTGYNSRQQEYSRRELVFCRITSSIDSTVNNLFESYAQMNVCNSGLLDYQPLISRYASSDEYIPGLAGNRLEFRIDPYVNLPIMVEQYMTRKGYIMQDSNQIAMVTINLYKNINTYYINVADTSVLYITSSFRSGKKQRIPRTQPVWQSDKVNSVEISFSHTSGNTRDYLIDWVGSSEEYRLIGKNKTWQNISRIAIFVVVPDSSMICSSVRDQVSHEALTEVRRQINFRAK